MKEASCAGTCLGSAALGLCWVRDICAPKAPCARMRHFECKGRRRHGISAGAAFALEMLTLATGCNHRAKNNMFGKLPRWAAPGWAAVGMQKLGARSGRCSQLPTAEAGPGRGGCSLGAGEGSLPALCAATTTHAAARGPCCSPLPGSERHREQSRGGGETAAQCSAQAPGLQRERWERGSCTKQWGFPDLEQAPGSVGAVRAAETLPHV